ncbi:MAG: CehA/McbA family metallohydrolase, partial [Myxococcales bacterium]|nr:CehA/McbA family metallohydrolase [Myxococcales bacterium]
MIAPTQAQRALRLGLALSLLLAACANEKPPSHLTNSNTELRMILASERPKRAREGVVLTRGDFLLTSRGLRVIVGGLHRKGDARGAIIEATYEGIPVGDSLARVIPTVHSGGSQRALAMNRIFIVDRDGTPTLRIEAGTVDGNVRFQVAHELSAGRVPGTLAIVTSVQNIGGRAAPDVRVGARIVWGGLSPFAPGAEALEAPSWQRTDWVGAEGAHGSTAFGATEGRVIALPVFEEGSGNKLLLHTNIVRAAGEALEPHERLVLKSTLALAPSGLSQAVRKLGFARGKPWPEAWFQLPYRPTGAEVVLLDAAGAELLRGRPDAAGRVVLPLLAAASDPKTGFLAYADAFGHAPSERVEWQGIPSVVRSLLIPRGGKIRVRARDSSDGSPIPARMRFVGIGGTASPKLGPDFNLGGAGDSAIALDGEATIPVPPGKYRVVVAHGPEWSFTTTEVEVNPSFSPLVETRLERQVDPGRWVASDLHVHATASPDSQVTNEDRIAALLVEGIHFAVSTDHNFISEYGSAIEHLQRDDFMTVSGVEITSGDPYIGHFNAFPFPMRDDMPGRGAPESYGIVPADLFAALHALDPDMVVQVNHPRLEGGIGYFDVTNFNAATGDADPIFSPAFDTMEVHNGFDLARPANVEAVFTDFLAILARGQRVAATGSSDSHVLRYQLNGFPRTYAYVDEAEANDPRAVVRAIKRGASFVTSGPFLEATVEGAGPGALATAVSGHAKLDVRVRTPDWIAVDKLEVFVNGALLLERTIKASSGAAKSAGERKPTRLDFKGLDIPAAADSYVVVRVSGTEPLALDFFGRASIP